MIGTAIAILLYRLFGAFGARAAERTALAPDPPTLADHLLRPFRQARFPEGCARLTSGIRNPGFEAPADPGGSAQTSGAAPDAE